MARTRYKIYQEQCPHFLTCTTVKWMPLFTNPSVAEYLLDSLRFLQAHERLIMYAYVIMEHHLHLVASSDKLAQEIGNFKSFTARKIIDYYAQNNAKNILRQLNIHKLQHRQDRSYQLWQESSHPQQILNEDMMRQKIDYIHLNPVRRGYIDNPVHWRYSSARSYAGMEGLLGVQTEW